MRSGFSGWLLGQGYAENSRRSRVAEASRVEEFYGDLDSHYDRDGFAALLDELAYSKDDQRQGRPNRARFQIIGDLYTNLASYRSALRRYASFRASEAASRSAPQAPGRRNLRRAFSTWLRMVQSAL